DMMNLAAGECGARRLVHRPPVAERHRMHDLELAVAGSFPVLGGEREQDAGHLRCGVRRDSTNMRMRVRAASEGAPKRSRRGKIVPEPAFALQEPRILAPVQRLADEPALDLGRIPAHPDACKVCQPKIVMPRTPACAARASSLRQKKFQECSQCAGVMICWVRFSRTARPGMRALMFHARA